MPDAEITLVDENLFISYGGCGIPYYVSGEVNNLDDLRATPYHTVRDPEFFRTMKGITVRNQTRAMAIDRAAKTLLVRNVVTGEEEKLPYDKLVLATGATPRMPPVEGHDLKNVLTLTRLEAADVIRKACEHGQVNEAVIVGGGFIGLEAAVALSDMWGVKVSVVEMMDQMLPGVLSHNMGKMAAHDCEAHGLSVYTSEKVVKLEGKDGAVCKVITDKRELPAQLVIFAAGFLPNGQLAKDAGLEVAPFGAIVVNEKMQTSDPDIYAGGDCVAIKNLITGKLGYLPLGSMANRQGRVIGTNAASDNGKAAAFHGAVGTWCVKIFKMSACGTGLTIERAKAFGFDAISASLEQLDRAHFYPEKHMMTLELVVERGTRRVLGIQGVCEDGDALKARIDAVATMLQFGKPTIDDLANAEIAYAPPFASAMDAVNAVANVADNILSGQLKPISSKEFGELWKDRANNNVFFADARPAVAGNATAAKYPGEWHAIALEDIEAKFDSIPKDRPVALVCNTGLRSYEVMLYLHNHGVTDVVNALGGMQALIKRGDNM